MKKQFLALLVISLATPSTSFAAATFLPPACFTASGNLDSSAPIVVPPAGAESEVLSPLAAVSTSIEVAPQGANHLLQVFFLHTGVNQWLLYVLARRDYGGYVMVTPSPIPLYFDANGTRIALPSNGRDIQVTMAWDIIHYQSLEMSFVPFTQRAAAGSVAALDTDCSDIPRTITRLRDFDNDGQDDLVLWVARSAAWAVVNSRDSSLSVKVSGGRTDVPLVGDYDGDRAPDLVTWQERSGMWTICTSGSSYDCSHPSLKALGARRDVPIVGDYDGDEIADPAVWRQSVSTLFYIGSLDGALHYRTYPGLAGTPVGKAVR